MRNIRLIARLDVKAPNLVKGIQFEGLRKLGDPNEFALKYYLQGADEIFYTDIVASLYGRNSLLDIIEKTSENVFIPITVGGGLRNINDVSAALRAGADKVAINTAAIKDPSIITEISRKFGSQCMVLSIQAKWQGNHWEAYYDNGREHSYLDVVEWAKTGERLGAGEIILTSIDREGTKKGFDVDLVKAVTNVVDIPVIAGGGMGAVENIECVIKEGRADAISIASVLHYNQVTIDDARKFCIENNIPVRSYALADDCV
jgi:imidazole glycerol-phosphate synthase subunit HisF